MNHTITIDIRNIMDAIKSLAIANMVKTVGIDVLNGEPVHREILRQEENAIAAIVAKYQIHINEPDEEYQDQYSAEFLSDMYCEMGSGFSNLATAIMIRQIQDWYSVDYEEAVIINEIVTRGELITIGRTTVEEKMVEFVLDSFRKNL